jgi:aminomethyltransferase
VLREHEAVRTSVGVFDVSHLGRLEASGPGVIDALDLTFCNLASGLDEGRTQYTMALNDLGGVIDDIILWRWGPEMVWVLPNAGNSERIQSDLEEAAPSASIIDLRPSTVSLAVQGPAAPALIESLLGVAVKRSRIEVTDFLGHEVRVAGTGYTGERGGEVVTTEAGARALMAALIDGGATPCGLAARDTLRLEAALPLWGQDLDESITPLEAGLGFAVALDHEFRGRDALVRQQREGRRRRRVLFQTEGRAIPRHGHALRSESRAGEVSSGNFSPTLHHGIGMGYLDGEDDPTEPLEFELRRTWHPASIVDRFLA